MHEAENYANSQNFNPRHMTAFQQEQVAIAAFLAGQRSVNADLLEAARQAVRTIRCWHGIQIGIAGQPELEEETWELYQQSPEMKKLNAAIERAEKAGHR